MKPTIYDPKSPALSGDKGHHPSHADISSLEGDELKRHSLPVHGDPLPTKPLGRKPRHNAVNGEVRTERLF